MKKNKLSDKMLPRIVYLMCVHGAFLVGSQAKRLIGARNRQTK